LINYRAIAAGLRSLGVQRCFSSAAVGSLNVQKGPGTVGICTDMIDLTARNLTLFDKEVKHTDMGEPFPLSQTLSRVCSAHVLETWEDVTYVGANGPRYEAPAEIRAMRILGGDVVGMTATSEAILCREAGVPYACLAVVTNLGCGLSKEELRHGEVTDVMKKMGGAVTEILLEAAIAT
jgi:5'-methylthioadenosine phosphorylase